MSELAIERLESNIEAVIELMENPIEDPISLLRDAVLPMLQEIMEGQIAILEGADDGPEGDEGDGGPQIVYIPAALYADLQGFLEYAATEPALAQNAKLDAFRLCVRLRGSVEDLDQEVVAADLAERLTGLRPQFESAPNADSPSSDHSTDAATPENGEPS